MAQLEAQEISTLWVGGSNPSKGVTSIWEGYMNRRKFFSIAPFALLGTTAMSETKASKEIVSSTMLIRTRDGKVYSPVLVEYMEDMTDDVRGVQILFDVDKA